MHTVELKDTIEYKSLCKSFGFGLLIFLIVLEIVVFLGINISFIIQFPFDIFFPVLIGTIICFAMMLAGPLSIVISEVKEKKKLIKNFDTYIEMEVSLSIPITVRGSAVKYIIKIKEENGREKEIESHSYSDSTVTGRRMLIGYDPTTNDIIFLKNV